MEAIEQLPPGTVEAKIDLRKDDYLIELVKIRYGSMVRFVERISRNSKTNVVTVLAFRQTDEFTQDSLATEWVEEYVKLKVNNEQYILTERSTHNG